MSVRKTLSRREFLGTAGAIGAGLLLGACAPKPTEEPAEEEPVSEAPAEESFTLQVLTFLDMAEPRTKAYYEYIEEHWKELHPNGELEHETAGWDEIDTKTAAYVAAGTPLDVGANWSGATPTWAAMGIVQPLEDWVPDWWWDTRLPAMIEPPSQALWEGKLYLASFTLEMPGMIYRADLLDQAGIDPPGIESWDDLLTAVEAVATKTDMEKPFALYLKNAGGAIDQTMNFWRGNGLNNSADFREDGSEAEPYIEAVDMIQKIMEYVPEDALNWYYDTGQQAWFAGLIGFYQHGQWLINSREQDTAGITDGEHMIARPYTYGPSLESQKPYWMFNATGFFLMTNAARPQEAGDWIAQATSTEACYRVSPANVPPTNDWTLERWRELTEWPDVEWWQEQWLDIIQDYPVRITPGFLAREEISQHQYENLIKLWRDQMTPEEFYIDMRDFAVPLLKEAEEAATQ